MLTTLFFVFGLAAMEKALLTMAAILFGGSLIFGIYDAWANKRGFLGWIVSGIAAIVGGVIGGIAGGAALGAAATFAVSAAGMQWPEADATFGLIGVIAGIVVGALLALRLANRFRTAS